MECFVITVDDVKIAMLPWVQAGKTSQLSAENTVKMIDRCQRVYNNFYKICKDKEGLPTPVTQGTLILNVAATVNDHASNEKCRVEFISKIRERVAAELDLTDELEGNPLVSFYCNTHKVVTTSCSTADGYPQTVPVAFSFALTLRLCWWRKRYARLTMTSCLTSVPIATLESSGHPHLHPSYSLSRAHSSAPPFALRSSNLLDTFQIQLAKMFGHHKDAYAFGNLTSP